MAQEVTIRRGNNAYTLLVESREGDIYATALKRPNASKRARGSSTEADFLYAANLSLARLDRTLTRVRVSMFWPRGGII